MIDLRDWLVIGINKIIFLTIIRIMDKMVNAGDGNVNDMKLA